MDADEVLLLVSVVCVVSVFSMSVAFTKLNIRPVVLGDAESLIPLAISVLITVPRTRVF